jgi:putative DNA primase/helicase
MAEELVATDAELPAGVAAWGESWGRVFAHAKGAECRDLLRKAAAEGWRVLEINRTVLPATDGLAHQAMVDRLHDWAIIAGIGTDDAQTIITEARNPLDGGGGDDGGADTENGARAPQFSDEALALEFAELHADRVRYVKPWGAWFIWTGVKWLTDDTLHVVDLARRLCRDAAQRCDKPKIAIAIASAKTVAAVERLARADRRLAATVDQWDRDPWLLNTPAGIVDLRTGRLGPHRADEYMTKISGVGPDASCSISLWMTFLKRVMNNDEELIAYLQRVAGYGLTGITSEHALFFCYGTGSNGKDTFLNALIGVSGDYHRTSPIEVFTASQGDRHPTELAGLRGARLVTATETEEGRRWAETKIKSVTGGGKITARFMRADFFDFYPQFKLIVAGNHKPGLRSVDEAIRRRMNLIPFTVTIPKEERDLTLGERLKAEWPGILAWTVAGCLEWQRHGLAAPAAVRSATENYLDAEDSLAAWFENECERDAQAWEGSMTLFASWKAYADRTGEFVGSIRRFVQRLEERSGALGLTKARGPNGRQGFVGVRLRRADASSDGGQGEAGQAADAADADRERDEIAF